MSETPYTVWPAKIPEYFAKFQEAGIPPKVDREWLKTVGFNSGNDGYIISVLKYIKFVDASNVPTETWKMYKDPTKARAVIAQAVKEGYKELFETYLDANRKDREALYAFFISKTGKAKVTVDYMVTTFLNLCQLADFEAEAPKIRVQPRAKSEVSGIPVAPLRPEKGIVPEIHVNIQLHLPATNDPTVYETLFKSLRKHLLSEEE